MAPGRFRRRLRDHRRLPRGARPGRCARPGHRPAPEHGDDPGARIIGQPAGIAALAVSRSSGPSAARDWLLGGHARPLREPPAATGCPPRTAAPRTIVMGQPCRVAWLERPRAVRVAMTRQVPVARISRLWLRSVHHRGPERSGPPPIASRSAAAVSRLAGSNVMVRTGRSDGWWKRMTPTGGSSSRWMTPSPGSRPVPVQRRSVRHANKTPLLAGSMSQVPGESGRDRSVVVTPGSLCSGRLS